MTNENSNAAAPELAAGCADYQEAQRSMLNTVRVLYRMSDEDRYSYMGLTPRDNSWCRDKLAFADCLQKYDIDELQAAAERYQIDHIHLGEIVIRIEDGQEYIVKTRADENSYYGPGTRSYNCVSLTDQSEFCLESITAIRRTGKYVNLGKLR